MGSPGSLFKVTDMKILMRRTGGFAGLDETLGELDTASLQRDEAAAIEQLAGQLDTTRRAASAEKQRVGADFVKYEISLADGQNRRSLVIADDGSPLAALARQLADRLTAHAKR